MARSRRGREAGPESKSEAGNEVASCFEKPRRYLAKFNIVSSLLLYEDSDFELNKRNVRFLLSASSFPLSDHGVCAQDTEEAEDCSIFSIAHRKKTLIGQTFSFCYIVYAFDVAPHSRSNLL